jgi:hypothetical protein
VINHWRWLGTAHDRVQAYALARGTQPPAFDADQYQIVQSALERAARGELEWVGLMRC